MAIFEIILAPFGAFSDTLFGPKMGHFHGVLLSSFRNTKSAQKGPRTDSGHVFECPTPSRMIIENVVFRPVLDLFWPLFDAFW